MKGGSLPGSSGFSEGAEPGGIVDPYRAVEDAHGKPQKIYLAIAVQDEK